MTNGIEKRTAIREMIADCFERAVRQVGEAEARRLWLGVLRQKAGSKPLVADQPMNGSPRTGSTMNALAFLAKTGRLPSGSPPWDMGDNQPVREPQATPTSGPLTPATTKARLEPEAGRRRPSTKAGEAVPEGTVRSSRVPTPQTGAILQKARLSLPTAAVSSMGSAPGAKVGDASTGPKLPRRV
jgi:hypothetical protein